MLLRAKAPTVILIALVISSLSTIPRASSSSATADVVERASLTHRTSGDDFVKGRAMDAMDALPLHFEDAPRETNSSVKFTARGCGIDFGIEPTNAVMQLREADESSKALTPVAFSSGRDIESQRQRARPPLPRSNPRKPVSLRLELIGANRRARVTGENQLAARTNYFVGNNASQWRTGVANYGGVRVEQVYRGIDVVYYGSGRQLEYDFKVAPGADFTAIRMRFAGARSLRIDERGDLLVATAVGVLRQHKPVAYQLVGGVRRETSARFFLDSNREVEFRLGDYDRGLPLVIDPALSFSTYLGGSNDDRIYGIALDLQGYAYVAGSTASPDFPVTAAAAQTGPHPGVGGNYGFVAKIDTVTGQLIYCSYIGGTRFEIPGVNISGGARNIAYGVAVDAAGNAYVTGQTNAVDFPTTAGCIQPLLAGGLDAFVVRINALGAALVYSTYLGSNNSAGPSSIFGAEDVGLSIAVDSAGSAYVTGRTSGRDFPTTPGALKATRSDSGPAGSDDPFIQFTDAFVTKLNPGGAALVYSTYLGGRGDDTGSGIRVDSAGNAYVVGTTQSRDFPTTNPFQAGFNGVADAFVAKVNHTGSALVYSTYIGGAGNDTGNAIAIDASGNAYFAGTTTSTDLPSTTGAFREASADVNIYKSTNGGLNWAASNTGVASSLPVSAIVVDPNNSNNLYAASASVLTSTDGGGHWRDSPASGTGSFPTKVLAFNPKQPSIAYGAWDPGRFTPYLTRSSDGGRTWDYFNSNFPGTFGRLESIASMAVDPVNTSTLYASTNAGLFKTLDGGNWIARGKGLPNNGAYCVLLAIDPKNPDHLFASASQELFISTNGGKKWEPTSLSDTTIFSVTFDPSKPSTICASGAGLFKSMDGGVSWQEVENDLLTFGVGKLVIDPTNSSVLYTTVKGGVFASVNGGQHWFEINDGLGPLFRGLNGPSVFLSIDAKNPKTLYASGPATGSDAFVGKLDPSGSTLGYLTYLGGAGSDTATGLAVDNDGNAYVTGQSYSLDFPVARAFQPDKSYSDADLFVTRLRADGTGVAYSTYVGGISYDFGTSIVADRFGNAYVAGYTYSPDFPLVGALQSSFRGVDGFIARIRDIDSSLPPPTITNIGPLTEMAVGQYVITIGGANFLAGARLRIGGVPLNVIEVNDHLIRAQGTRRPGGLVDVVDAVITNPDGQSAVEKNGVTFLPIPRIDGASIYGKELTVVGDGFDKGAVILVNGSAQKTNYGLNPTISTVSALSKKAATKIAPGATAVIQVRNVYGLTSPPFSYTRPNK